MCEGGGGGHTQRGRRGRRGPDTRAPAGKPQRRTTQAPTSRTPRAFPSPRAPGATAAATPTAGRHALANGGGGGGEARQRRRAGDGRPGRLQPASQPGVWPRSLTRGSPSLAHRASPPLPPGRAASDGRSLLDRERGQAPSLLSVAPNWLPRLRRWCEGEAIGSGPRQLRRREPRLPPATPFGL